jgi:hypothetical protein
VNTEECLCSWIIIRMQDKDHIMKNNNKVLKNVTKLRYLE